jgi:hypothetical protein
MKSPGKNQIGKSSTVTLLFFSTLFLLLYSPPSSLQSMRSEQHCLCSTLHMTSLSALIASQHSSVFYTQPLHPLPITAWQRQHRGQEGAGRRRRRRRKAEKCKEERKTILSRGEERDIFDICTSNESSFSRGVGKY